RLATALRAKGTPYRAASSFERWATRGTFEITTVTRAEDAVPVLQLIQAEVARLRDDGPTADELTSAQRELAGAYPLGFQRTADLAAAVASAELHSLGDSYVREFPVKLDAVTLDDAKRAAKAQLHPTDVDVVIVGRAASIEPALTAAKI